MLQYILCVNPLIIFFLPSSPSTENPAKGSEHIWAERLTNALKPSSKAWLGPSHTVKAEARVSRSGLCEAWDEGSSLAIFPICKMGIML